MTGTKSALIKGGLKMFNTFPASVVTCNVIKKTIQLIATSSTGSPPTITWIYNGPYKEGDRFGFYQLVKITDPEDGHDVPVQFMSAGFSFQTQLPAQPKYVWDHNFWEMDQTFHSTYSSKFIPNKTVIVGYDGHGPEELHPLVSLVSIGTHQKTININGQPTTLDFWRKNGGGLTLSCKHEGTVTLVVGCRDRHGNESFLTKTITIDPAN